MLKSAFAEKTGLIHANDEKTGPIHVPQPER